MKRRKPYPKRRQPRKVPFSAAMWERWLREQSWASFANPDEQAMHLRAGIEDFRQRVVVGRA